MRLRTRGRRSASLAVLLALALVAPLSAGVNQAGADSEPKSTAEEVIRQYKIYGPSSAAERTAVAATGVSIDEADDHSIVVSANSAQLRKLRTLSHHPEALPTPPDRSVKDLGVRPFDFPSADAKYHNHAEMNAEIDQRLAAYPSLMS
ncbi:zinc carboxypeptidase, partial [Streptomyces sp. NPDC056069]